jgi:deoxyribodipyrimidine photolyase-related protein
MIRGARKTTVWVLGDQLSPRISCLDGLAPADCTVLMIESRARAGRRPYHKHKLVFLWSAMRHFAAELRSLGYAVDYRADQPGYATALARHVRRHRPARIRLMETAEYGGSQRLAAMAVSHGIAVEVTPNNMFLSDPDDFARWAASRKTWRMETFYRRMRRHTGLLMHDGEPVGGEWNYDHLNRETPPPGQVFPKLPACRPDAITRTVMRVVQQRFPQHFGSVDGFWLPTSRRAAARFAEDFFQHRLDLFGPYEDAIVDGEPNLYHSLLSPLLNVGLLDPLALCRRAEDCYRSGSARLASVEGFIRQIIGWREFVYRVYRLKMPDYVRQNALGAELPLPQFYWSGDTDMRCVADAVEHVRRRAMNHHIQRLMITGNFALLAGIEPNAVNDWYRLAYADAFDWVVTPNVLGMALWADGGLLATKPYAASANYIGKMSDCCGSCAYDARAATGPQSCPFNSLYWDFLARHRRQFARNPRMSLVLAGLARREAKQVRAIRARAAEIRGKLKRGERI